MNERNLQNRSFGIAAGRFPVLAAKQPIHITERASAPRASRLGQRALALAVTAFLLGASATIASAQDVFGTWSGTVSVREDFRNEWTEVKSNGQRSGVNNTQTSTTTRTIGPTRGRWPINTPYKNIVTLPSTSASITCSGHGYSYIEGFSWTRSTAECVGRWDGAIDQVYVTVNSDSTYLLAAPPADARVLVRETDSSGRNSERFAYRGSYFGHYSTGNQPFEPGAPRRLRGTATVPWPSWGAGSLVTYEWDLSFTPDGGDGDGGGGPPGGPPPPPPCSGGGVPPGAGPDALATYAQEFPQAATAIAADGITRVLLAVPADAPVKFDVDHSADGGFASTDSPCGAGPPSALIAPKALSDGRTVAFAWYTAPAAFDVPSSTRTQRPITVRITAGGSVRTTTLQLHRAPLVLVHGVWSSSDTWGPDFMRTLSSGGFPEQNVFKADYREASAKSFDPTRPGNLGILAVKGAIGRALTAYRQRGIAVSRVDVVGHSMGGLMTRGVIQQPGYQKPSNYNVGTVHRLITIGTPHFGSELAQAVYENRKKIVWIDPGACVPLFITCTPDIDAVRLEDLLKAANKPVTEGGAQALVPFSDAYLALAASALPVHGIVATWRGGIGADGLRAAAAKSALDELVSIATGRELSQVFGTTEHDTIVSIPSQIGSLSSMPGARTGFTQTIHASVPGGATAETTSAGIAARVATLLTAFQPEQWAPGFAAGASLGPITPLTLSAALRVPSASSGVEDALDAGGAVIAGASVSPGAFDPLSASGAPRALALAASNRPGISLTEPLDGTLVVDGANRAITLRAQARNGAVPTSLLYFIEGWGMYWAPANAPYEVTMQVPEEAIRFGQLTVGVLALDASGALMADAVSVRLEPGASPVALRVEPAPVTLLHEAPTQRLRVLADYQYGTSVVTRDVTASSATSYHPGHSGAIASVDEDGVVRAVNSGHTAVQVTHGGLTASTDVTVSCPSTGCTRDGDGLPDDWENAYGLAADAVSGNDGALGDGDADGLSNFEEFQAGTNPTVANNAALSGPGVFYRYFGEGATGEFFTTRLALLNPGIHAAKVNLRFQRADGVVVPYQPVVQVTESRPRCLGDRAA